jgi:hypothetical protein
MPLKQVGTGAQCDEMAVMAFTVFAPSAEHYRGAAAC